MKTRMVEGHRRMTSSTVCSVVGNASFFMLALCSVRVTARCAGANSAAISQFVSQIAVAQTELA